MKLPIELKSNEFVVLVSIDVDPNYSINDKNMDAFYLSLPKSFKPIFKKLVNSTIRLYCVCNNEDDFTFCLRQTGYKTTLL